MRYVLPACEHSEVVLQVRREHEELRKRRLDEFMTGFNAISLRLKEMYQMITLGGDAELELVDSLDPFSEVRLCWCLSDAAVVIFGMVLWMQLSMAEVCCLTHATVR